MKRNIYIIFILILITTSSITISKAQLSAETAVAVKIQTYKQTAWQVVNKKLKVISNKLNSKQLHIAKKGWERLSKVSNQIRNYKRVKSIIARQLVIVKMAKDGTRRFSRDKNFNPRQVQAIVQSYQILISESIGLLAQLKLILKSNALIMSDAERIRAIDNLDDRMNSLYRATYQHTGKLENTSKYKSQEVKEREYLKKLFGFN